MGGLWTLSTDCAIVNKVPRGQPSITGSLLTAVTHSVSANHWGAQS